MTTIYWDEIKVGDILTDAPARRRGTHSGVISYERCSRWQDCAWMAHAAAVANVHPGRANTFTFEGLWRVIRRIAKRAATIGCHVTVNAPVGWELEAFRGGFSSATLQIVRASQIVETVTIGAVYYARRIPWHAHGRAWGSTGCFANVPAMFEKLELTKKAAAVTFAPGQWCYDRPSHAIAA